MYKAFFGLKEWPFRNNLDSAFFYEKASRLEILQALTYVVRRGDAIIKVIGEVGSGKTTLLRLLAQNLTDGYKLVYINSPNLSPKDLLLTIATELEIQFTYDISKHQLLELIRNDLLARYSKNEKVVVLVDEAQSIRVDTLEELRLLTNIETDKEKLIQLVLFGQPELDIAIDNPMLRQLKSRITYSINIPALTVSDVYDYLNHRMRVASYKGLDFFNYKNAKRIHQLSQGLPRTINAIADQLLMSSYGLGDTTLKAKHFHNLNSKDLYRPQTKHNYLFSISLVTVLSFITLIVFLQYFNQQPASQEVSRFLDSQNDLTNQNADNEVVNTLISTELPEETTLNAVDEIETVEIIEESISTEQVDSTSDTSNILTFPNMVVSTGSEITLNYLIKLHSNTESWLDSLKNSDYVIQLSTSSVDKFHKNVESYNRFKNVMTNLHFMLVLNQEGKITRVKTLYLSSSSYSFLRKELAVLPESIKRAQPFIVNASTLKETAKSTSLKLKAMEIQ
ncbi:MAG TPA: AAA family ATPase [Thiomicrospira sp.]|nr:AAA family ATPase [Thiomicrospira sp.]